MTMGMSAEFSVREVACPACIKPRPLVKSPVWVAKATAKDEPVNIEASPFASLKASITARPAPVTARAAPEAFMICDNRMV